MIQVYNTLTRKKEPFVPIVEGKVSMYVCGPTVYNYIHIGNGRSAIAFDVIRRYFEYRGFEVNFVSNFTDVDDKIIKRANEENVTSEEIAEKYIKAFKEDVSRLNVLPATHNPRAMESISDIILFVEDLIAKGFAYESQGDVYFRADKSADYGKLANKTIEELRTGAGGRVGEEANRKESAVDFALWKKAKAGEPSWASPWSAGRPGWHIECSVMAGKYLGDTLDIHGGGSDLEFPHHTNEIAQSEAKTGKQFVHYWLHNGFVTVGEEDEKMSKSLGNFVTVHELLKEYDGQIIRFLMSGTHYRRPIRFSEKAICEAKSNLEKLKNSFEAITFRQKDAVEKVDEEKLTELEQFEAEFTREMDDDFNAANGLSVIYKLSTWLNVYAEAEEVSAVVIEKAVGKYLAWLSIFGIEFASQELLDTDIEALIEERNQARAAKNFARADEIRDELLTKGITLLDTAQGTRFKKD